MTRTQTIFRIALFLVPLSFAVVLLGYRSIPKISRSERNAMILACLIIAGFGAAMNYLLPQ